MNIIITPELVGIILTLLTSGFTLAYVFGSLRAKVDIVIGDIKEMKHDVLDLNSRVGRLEGALTAAGHSPLRMTKAGNEIFEAVQGKLFVDTNFDQLVTIVNEINSANAYDIQMQSIKAIEVLMSGDDLMHAKNYAYKNGNTLDQIFEVMGLYLRDCIMFDAA
jgi:hypothetical protein